MILLKPDKRFSKIITLLSLVWVLDIQSGLAQHHGFKKYTFDDAIPQSEVISINQDSRGFVWIGTKFGISRFDGNSFVTRFDSLGMLRSPVRYVDELAGGSVIVSSSSGYVLFYPDDRMAIDRYPEVFCDFILSQWVAGGKAFIAFAKKQPFCIYYESVKV